LYSFDFGRNLRIMTCSVLLDLDGALIDSRPGILASCLAALRALGHEPDESLGAIERRSQARRLPLHTGNTSGKST
jgi:phosphoglycolate phosphatase-like HAD superfamily hydrolase